MKKSLMPMLVALAGLWAVQPIELAASGQSGIYAVVERVAVEPSSGPADRIQVWGAFAIMERAGRGFTTYVFRKPARGYMYFQLPTGKPEDIANARREWTDLASVAGTRQAVAFGYWDQYAGNAMPTVRTGDAKPLDPDTYYTNVGLSKIPAGGVVDELLKLIGPGSR
jgi:hypothetical protein